MNFMEYNPEQSSMVYLNLEERIPQQHLVRYVSNIIEKLDLRELYNSYSEEGRPAYHPMMMLKVIIYAYMMGIYTSRKIARALRENIYFMWLAAEQQPDHRTINDFVSGRCCKYLERIFCQVVLFAQDAGYLSLNNSFVDGTTLQANAGRTSYVWKKNAERYRQQKLAKLTVLFTEIQALNAQEEVELGEYDLPELGEHLSAAQLCHNEQVSSGDVAKLLQQERERLNVVLKALNRKTTQNKSQIPKILSALTKLKNVEKHELPKLEKYEEQVSICGDNRSSYSKTDTDATFMHMKDDRLLPSYTVMISTSEQFVTDLHLYNNPAESQEFPTLMESYHHKYQQHPTQVVGDAAYGTARNLHYANDNNIKSYLKTQDFHCDYRDELGTDFIYDADSDTWTCKYGRKLHFEETRTKCEHGTERTIRVYRSESCEACPFADKCIRYKSQTQRTISFDPVFESLKRQTVNNLESKEGIALRKKRCIEPEPVFGNLKYNKGFTRFMYRGLAKCKTQIGLLFMAQNIGKMFVRHEQAMAIA
jgi:transposase